MPILRLLAKDPLTGKPFAYRCYNRLVYERLNASTYTNASTARVGMASAIKNWPKYDWVAVDRNGVEVDIGPPRKSVFSREEVWQLVLKERAGCAREALVCFGLGADRVIEESRPTNLLELEQCETKPSTP